MAPRLARRPAGQVVIGPARHLRLLPRPTWLTATLLLAGLVGGSIGVLHATPNPYRMVDEWVRLPAGRTMGAVGDLALDPDGRHLWVIVRCAPSPDARFGSECLNSHLDPILQLDLDGNVVKSFGADLFIWPHGLDVDREGNVWVTDAVSPARTPPGKRGHQVIKFSPEGRVLLTLGTPGEPGGGEGHLNSPSDVAVAADGSVFVADSHSFDDGNNRIVKFSRDGKFVKAWGRTGYAPGEFRMAHCVAISPDGRVFVADRGNNRVQIFDQEGKFLAQWTQFGRPSGICFDTAGRVYVADSESDNVQNPGWEIGVRVGDARTGWVSAFVPFPWGDPREIEGNGAEFVAVDRAGNLYGGEPRPRVLRKYVRVIP